MEEVAVYLTSKEAELFKKFRQYQDLWNKVFNIKDGSVELHFDSQGVISKVGYNNIEKVIHN